MSENQNITEPCVIIRSDDSVEQQIFHAVEIHTDESWIAPEDLAWHVFEHAIREDRLVELDVYDFRDGRIELVSAGWAWQVTGMRIEDGEIPDLVIHIFDKVEEFMKELSTYPSATTEMADSATIEENEPQAADDLRLSKLCGKMIGKGQFRRVFEHRDDPALVIKTGNCKMNQREARIWETYEDSTALAPVIECSESGKYLVMRKTEGEPEISDRSVRVMANIAQVLGGYDMNYENYGFLDGYLVCHDYGGMDDSCVLQRHAGANHIEVDDTDDLDLNPTFQP